MATINLKICMGTMCYVMGGADLKSVAETLPYEVKKHLSVTYSPCLGCCNKQQTPPYVELNGRIIAGVSKNNLVQLLKEELANVI